jgi:hypothetical protein
MEFLEFPVDDWHFSRSYFRAISIAISGRVHAGVLYSAEDIANVTIAATDV